MARRRTYTTGWYTIYIRSRLSFKPLLPSMPRGAPRVDECWVLNSMLWRFHFGVLGMESQSAMAHRRPAATASSVGKRPVCGTACNQIKRFLAIATRYDKDPANDLVLGATAPPHSPALQVRRVCPKRWMQQRGTSEAALRQRG